MATMIRIFGENMEENGVKESTLSRNHGTDIKDRRPIKRMFPPEQKGAAAYDVYAFESKAIAAPCEFTRAWLGKQTAQNVHKLLQRKRRFKTHT